MFRESVHKRRIRRGFRKFHRVEGRVTEVNNYTPTFFDVLPKNRSDSPYTTETSVLGSVPGRGVGPSEDVGPDPTSRRWTLEVSGGDFLLFL